MNLHVCVAKSLWIETLLTLFAVVAAALWLLLSSLGDSMAVAMRAVTLLLLVCWTLNFVVLVALLAWAELRRADSEQSGQAGPDLDEE